MSTALRSFMFAGAIAAAMSAGALPSQATTFNWSISGPGFTGGGTMEVTLLSGVTYSLDSISGNVNGDPILGLSAYDGPDQRIYYPATAVIDTLGFSFSIGDGSTSYNIYEDFGNYDPNSYYSCGGVPYCILGPGATDGSGIGPGGDVVTALETLDIAPVPEPSTWAMMIAGLAGLGWFGYVHRRARQAAAA